MPLKLETSSGIKVEASYHESNVVSGVEFTSEISSAEEVKVSSEPEEASTKEGSAKEVSLKGPMWYKKH